MHTGAGGARGLIGFLLRSLAVMGAGLLFVQPTACGPKLPEPDSAGARLYRERCTGCHRLFAPASMTRATWEINVRMHVEGSRRGGKVPLSREEQRLLLEYLARFSGNAS